MSIYYAVLYKYPSLEGSHVTYVLSGGTHFQWGWVPHAMAPLPPVFHQGDLVHGSGPFLAGNPDLRHLWLNRSNYRHGKSLSTTRSLWKPMKRIKKNTTTTLRLATKIKHRSQSQVVSQFSPVNHRAGKNCETLHLHDQSPLTLHLEGFSGFFFFGIPVGQTAEGDPEFRLSYAASEEAQMPFDPPMPAIMGWWTFWGFSFMTRMCCS